MLKKKQLKIRVIEKKQLLIKGAKEEIIKKIKKSETKNDEIVKTIEEIKKARVKVSRNEKQQIENELVLKEEKIYVPKNENLRLEIIQLHYNILIVVYGRQQKTVKLVTRNY